MSATGNLAVTLVQACPPDVEHTLVDDDPRAWSKARKTSTLSIVSGASMIAGLCVVIQNPSNAQIEQQLHATSQQISLSLSLPILAQGNFPVFWSAVSEIKGRKLVYLVSIVLFILGSATVAVSKTIGLLIGMRIVQATGTSAVLTIGAATLADIYEPHERGTVMGIYYCAPLLGPSLGPIMGGVLTQTFSWRAVFWFLVIWGGIVFFAFCFLFRDTFRRERSLTYQSALRKRMHKLECHSLEANSPTREKREDGQSGVQIRKDVEAHPAPVNSVVAKDITLSFADINPFPSYAKILGRKHNLMILIPSGLLFAFTYSISYTCARTLSLYYSYDALSTGLVLLSFGIGSLLGSVLGGRWSDRTLVRLRTANDGMSFPEMRLESTRVAMWWLPPAVIGYAWVCQEHVHITAICAMLFFSGFFSVWIYSSTLAYIVDSNPGRSSSAVAMNSLVRGVSGFVAAEIAIPLQDAIGDGGLYTAWAGMLLLAELMILLVLYKGRRWRETSNEMEQ
ncbi:vacuolar DHA amino acid exporter [Pisolithus thermaeus]|nr:vacuolar DHA amino acid exporter [Pisolithus thermaeus]